MNKILAAIKKYWAIILGAIGILIVSIGAIFGNRRVQKSNAAGTHKAYIAGTEDVLAAIKRDKERRLIATKEANEKLSNVDLEKEKEIEELVNKNTNELTELVSKKFNFKNEDSK